MLLACVSVLHDFYPYLNFNLTVKARFLKFHLCTPHEKIADPFILLSELSLIVESWPFEKQWNNLMGTMSRKVIRLEASKFG